MHVLASQVNSLHSVTELHGPRCCCTNVNMHVCIYVYACCLLCTPDNDCTAVLSQSALAPAGCSCSTSRLVELASNMQPFTFLPTISVSTHTMIRSGRKDSYTQQSPATSHACKYQAYAHIQAIAYPASLATNARPCSMNMDRSSKIKSQDCPSPALDTIAAKVYPSDGAGAATAPWPPEMKAIAQVTF